ncbi:MAG: glycosyltransferase family 4 protein [Pseudomonadota bacterium]
MPSRKITIAFVIPRFGGVGGSERFVSELADQMVFQEDFEIHVLANRWYNENPLIRFHKIPIIRYPRIMRPVIFAFLVKKEIEKSHFDLIHAHDRIFRMDILTMHGIPHKTWVKKVRHKHLSLFDRTTSWVEKRGINGHYCPVVLPVSELVREELQKLYDIPESKIKVVHPGVSAERFSFFNKEACRNAIRRKYGFLLNDLVILFVSMNFEVKRLDLLIKGMAALVNHDKRCHPVKLLVVGKGNKSKYLQIARNFGVADRIAFCGITHEVEKYYLASDLFVMPSSYDTFGLVVLEAMMAGLPVIITENVGAKDLVRSGVHGFVLKDDPSPSDIAEKIAFFLNRENRLSMGENAKKTAFDHTWDKKGFLMAEIYRSLFNNKKEFALSPQIHCKAEA